MSREAFREKSGSFCYALTDVQFGTSTSDVRWNEPSDGGGVVVLDIA